MASINSLISTNLMRKTISLCSFSKLVVTTKPRLVSFQKNHLVTNINLSLINHKLNLPLPVVLSGISDFPDQELPGPPPPEFPNLTPDYNPIPKEVPEIGKDPEIVEPTPPEINTDPDPESPLPSKEPEFPGPAMPSPPDPMIPKKVSPGPPPDAVPRIPPDILPPDAPSKK